MNKSRRKEIEKITVKLIELRDLLEQVKDEEAEAFSKLPESIKYSAESEEYFCTLDEVYDNLDDAVDQLMDIVNG